MNTADIWLFNKNVNFYVFVARYLIIYTNTITNVRNVVNSFNIMQIKLYM